MIGRLSILQNKDKQKNEAKSVDLHHVGAIKNQIISLTRVIEFEHRSSSF